ncbi:MAG TPA: hypothetical protein VEZ11_14505 [Thermoanaerobaculia bacterium]|nr:hypothetical protein [Thermoanaerobaculia bacterium]
MTTGTADAPSGRQPLAGGIAAAAAAVIAIAATALIGRTIWSSLALPSVTSIVLLLDLLMRPFRLRLFSLEDRALVLRVVVAIALPLYATTLAYVPGDLYRLGFSPWLAALFALAAAIVAPRHPRVAVLTLLILVALDLELLPSLNSFDYLVDPIVGLVALVWLGRQTVMAVAAGIRNKTKATT